MRNRRVDHDHLDRSRNGHAVDGERTDIEKQRVEMANQSLALFDDFMKLREDLAAGRLAGLDQRAKAYVDRLLKLGDKYEKQFASDVRKKAEKAAAWLA